MLRVNLTWTADSQATGYRIYRSTSPITQASLSNDLIAVITAGTASSYSDGGDDFTVQGTTATASPVISNLASTSLLAPGMSVTGTNIPAGAYILSVDSATQITLSAAAIGAGTGSLTFNGSTTLTPPVQTQYTVSFNLNFVGHNAANSTTFTLSNAADAAALLAYFNNVGGAGVIVVTGPSGSGIQANTRIMNIVGNTVTLSNAITVGHVGINTVTLTFGTPLTYTGTAAIDIANLKAALEAMPTIGVGNVSVTADSSDSVYTITFQNTLANLPQNPISAGILQGIAGRNRR